jgi:hypothetical protein
MSKDSQPLIVIIATTKSIALLKMTGVVPAPPDAISQESFRVATARKIRERFNCHDT